MLHLQHEEKNHMSDLQDRTDNDRQGLLSSVCECLDAGMEKEPPAHQSPANENERAVICSRLSEKKETGKNSVRKMREAKSRNAPRGLFQTIECYLALPSLSFAPS